MGIWMPRGSEDWVWVVFVWVEVRLGGVGVENWMCVWYLRMLSGTLWRNGFDDFVGVKGEGRVALCVPFREASLLCPTPKRARDLVGCAEVSGQRRN